MGQSLSDNSNNPNNINFQGPFSLKSHNPRCTLKKAVEFNDFFVFQTELKSCLKSIGISQVRLNEPSEYVATVDSDRCDITSFLAENVKLYSFNRRLSTSFLDHRGFHTSRRSSKILTSKISVNGKRSSGSYASSSKVMVYIPCSCPGRYAGMDINQYDRTGRTALNVAIRKRDSILIKLYLHCGVDPNKWNKYGETPLHMASVMGFYVAVELLLKNGADSNLVDQPPTNLLLQAKETPTIAAAAHGHGMCLTELLKQGAEPNSQDRDGNTALHKSAQYGYRTCVKILLKYKVNVNVRNNDRITPLQMALLHMNSDVASTLVSFGCDVTSYSNELPSILSLAALSGELEIVEKCIKEGEQIDKVDKFSKTALYYVFTLDSHLLRKLPLCTEHACRLNGHLQIPKRKEIVELLIRSGANVELVLMECLRQQNPSRDVLDKKHFSLPQNIAIFQRMIQACGFNRISVEEATDLFWQMLNSNGRMLAKLLVFALPRLDHRVSRRLSEALDWTGAHTEHAVYAHLESAGSDLETSNWIIKRMKQPRSLQEWSRESIRRCISSNVNKNVEMLPVPAMLKDYICLRDVLTI